MMQHFKIERRNKATFGVYFPESVTKERQQWGLTHIGTCGIWHSFRFVTGALDKLRSEIGKVAVKYSAQRKRMPNIDMFSLFENIPQVRSTGLEYYDYAGRIDTISREAVMIQSQSGARIALNRDKGVGFRGIIVRSESPWSMEAYATREMQRMRIDMLNKGMNIPDALGTYRLTVDQPWRLRDAVERQLETLLDVAWTEYVADNTPEKLNIVIGVDKMIRDYIVNSLAWLAKAGDWEHASRIPFPDAPTALNLWEEDKIDTLDYDSTEPWWIEDAKVPETEVTMVRRAILSSGKVTITITTNPNISVLSHPTIDASHHLLSYGPHHHVGVALENPDRKTIHNTPFVGFPKKEGAFEVEDFEPPWGGHLKITPGWSVMKAESTGLPEPKLSVRSRVIKLNSEAAERLAAAATSDRPTLVWEDINRATAPILVLPRIFLQTMVYPLFTGGISLKSIEDGNMADGWVTNGVGEVRAATRFVAPPDYGFLSTPSEGVPMREGNTQEIIPFA